MTLRRKLHDWVKRLSKDRGLPAARSRRRSTRARRAHSDIANPTESLEQRLVLSAVVVGLSLEGATIDLVTRANLLRASSDGTQIHTYDQRTFIVRDSDIFSIDVSVGTEVENGGASGWSFATTDTVSNEALLRSQEPVGIGLDQQEAFGEYNLLVRITADHAGVVTERKGVHTIFDYQSPADAAFGVLTSEASSSQQDLSKITQEPVSTDCVGHIISHVAQDSHTAFGDSIEEVDDSESVQETIAERRAMGPTQISRTETSRRALAAVGPVPSPPLLGDSVNVSDDSDLHTSLQVLVRVDAELEDLLVEIDASSAELIAELETFLFVAAPDQAPPQFTWTVVSTRTRTPVRGVRGEAPSSSQQTVTATPTPEATTQIFVSTQTPKVDAAQQATRTRVESQPDSQSKRRRGPVAAVQSTRATAPSPQPERASLSRKITKPNSGLATDESARRSVEQDPHQPDQLTERDNLTFEPATVLEHQTTAEPANAIETIQLAAQPELAIGPPPPVTEQREAAIWLESRLQNAELSEPVAFLSGRPPVEAQESTVLQQLEYDNSPRGPPADVLVASPDSGRLSAIRLRMLRHSLAPRSPSGVSAI